MSSANLRQRVALTTCARCRKTLNPGDRVVMLLIVQKVGWNPETRDAGAFLGEDFELSHADCTDPSVSGRLLVP